MLMPRDVLGWTDTNLPPLPLPGPDYKLFAGCIVKIASIGLRLDMDLLRFIYLVLFIYY
jgi:hypothetical protein